MALVSYRVNIYQIIFPKKFIFWGYEIFNYLKGKRKYGQVVIGLNVTKPTPSEIGPLGWWAKD